MLKELLGKADISGATIIERGVGKDGTWYSLCEFSIERAKNLLKLSFERVSQEKKGKLLKDKLAEMHKRIEEVF